MPRTRKAVHQPNAVVASAARVLAGKRKNMPKGGAIAWQNEAWEMLDVVGELEFYRELISNAGSRCTVKAVEDYIDKDGKPAVRDATDPLVVQAMAALFGGEAGQSEMLGAMFGHLAIPGETWLCGLLEPPASADGPDMWRVLAKDEVSEVGTKWQIDRGDGEPELYSADQVYMARIWDPHPRKWVHANSSVRSALPILRELVGLSKRQAAIIDSRLAGAGILAVPTEITFAAPATPDEDAENDEQQDPFMAALIEAMTTALEDQGDASAVVPLVVKAPAEHLDKIKHISLASALDEKGIEQRKELLGRLANSLNIPAEMLTGMGDVNHWGQWFTEESSIKMHIEPVLGTVARGLTTRYLWPILQGEGNETMPPELRRFRIVGETSNLRQRPNRSTEAQTAHEKLIITDAAWAREVGFETTDLLVQGSEEFKRRMLMSIADGVTTADLTAAAMAELGVPLTPKVSEVEPEATGTPPPAALPEPPQAIEAPQDNREPPTPDPEPPALGASSGPTQDQVAAVLAVSENLVLRAVERGWNRAGRRGRVRKPVPQDQMDAALSDAWLSIERNASLLGVDSFRLQDTLDSYARALLASGAEHDPHVLVRLIQERVLCDEEAGSVSSAVVAALGQRAERQHEQQPINLTVQVTQPENNIQVHLPSGLVAAAAAPQVHVPAPQVTVNVPEGRAPEVTVNVEPTPVNITNDVQPTPVTVEATVESPTVMVESPEVNVTVEPTPVEVTVEAPKPRTTRTKVIRDADGNITGSEEREV